MERPKQFPHNRFVGDKRTQRVFDLDDPTVDENAVRALLEAEAFATFGPDTLTEARNRGYRPARRR
ncbi:MAG: hypothetical protein ACOYN3_04185 [Acidimicrobiia bacterium]